MTQAIDEDHSSARADGDPRAERSVEELAEYGIVSVQLTSYEWGGYRYSNAADALAAAKRAAR